MPAGAQGPVSSVGQAPGGQFPGGHAPGSQAPGVLIGRAAETAEIRRLLDSRRLITVTGLPGVGKTAVSLAAAAAAAGSFADGVLLVRLDTLRDEALLPHTIMTALGVPDRFTRSPLDVLTGQLRDRRMLLVLDTCEHLLGACAGLIAALLAPCPKVRILATSREPLRVPGEAELGVRPLRLRDALALFTRQAAEAGLRVAPENRATAASICVQLDKLPLAINLAAAELARDEAARDEASGAGTAGDEAAGDEASGAGTAGDEAAGDEASGAGTAGPRSPSARLSRLLSRLEADYDFPRDPGQAAARHQTLRAAIGWSHELCTPAERLLWARVSVFEGPFRLPDAQDVCTTSQLADEAVAAGLSLLTERSVLLADERTPGGRGFLLPVTLRGYGRQMLRRLGEDAEFGDRYRRWQDTRGRDRGTRAAN